MPSLRSSAEMFEEIRRARLREKSPLYDILIERGWGLSTKDSSPPPPPPFLWNFRSPSRCNTLPPTNMEVHKGPFQHESRLSTGVCAQTHGIAGGRVSKREKADADLRQAGLHQSLFERLIFLGIRPVRLEACWWNAPLGFQGPSIGFFWRPL